MEEDLKKLLDNEVGTGMSDGLFRQFLGATTEVHLKNGEMLVPAGKIDTNLYIVKSGILRACYFTGGNEKTYGFADSGSVLISYHCFRMDLPSFFQFEACGETVMLRMPQKELYELVDSSPEFAKWLLASQVTQLFYNEFKHAAITGTAKERYLMLIEKRPEIIANVQSKIIASYLGVAPQYLSYLKKKLLKLGKEAKIKNS